MAKQVQWVVAALAACVIALAASCDTTNTGAGDILVNSPTLPGQEAVDQANEDRLVPAVNAETFALKGTLGIVGLTLLNSAGGAVPAIDALPELDARLLDPEEDILSQVHPGLDGRFTLSFTAGNGVNHTSQAGVKAAAQDTLESANEEYVAQFTVSGRVEEDLDGDGEGGDEFTLNVPLTLLKGFEVEASLEIRYGDERRVDPALVPETGWFLLVTLNAVDADGAKQDTYCVFFAEATTVFDTDGDGYLEFDDYQGEDENLDGVVDDFVMNPDNMMLAPAAIEGQITAVNVAELTITLRTKTKLVYTLQLSQFTPIELWDIEGNPIGVLPLGSQLIGRWASAEGAQQGFTIEPYQVVVYQED